MNQQTTRPQTATEILKLAGNTLGERGKQYDPAGKQERSMTAIVAAFNAIYPRNLLTVHMGWQFMALVKMVRGATKPHADSALDQVAYAALAAEEVAEQLHQPPVEAEYRLRTLSTGSSYVEEVKPTEAKRVEEMQQANHGLAEELSKYWHSTNVQAQEIKRLTDKLAAQQELLTVAQHNANFYFDKTNTEYGLNRELRANLEAQGRLVAELKDELASRAAHYAPLEQHVRSLEIQNDILRSSLSQYACRFDLDRDYVLASNSYAAQVKSLERELETVRGECISRGAQLAELRTQVRHVPERPVAHNTDEPKAAQSMAPYADPYDSHGGVQPKPLHRTVGSADPARGGLAYPQGKPLEPL